MIEYTVDILQRSNLSSHVVTMPVVDIGKCNSIISQLFDNCSLLLLVTMIVVPCCLAYEKVFPHQIVLVVVTLPEQIKLRLEVGRDDAANAGTCIRNVLSLLVISHNNRDFRAHSVESCVIFILKSVLKKVGSILRFKETIHVGETWSLYLTLVRPCKVSGCPWSDGLLRSCNQIMVSFVLTYFIYVTLHHLFQLNFK